MKLRKGRGMWEGWREKGGFVLCLRWKGERKIINKTKKAGKEII